MTVKGDKQTTNLAAENGRPETQRGKLVTLTMEMQMGGVQEDAQTGDLTFWATAVDKNAKPNRKGFVFAWEKPEDVIVDAFRENAVMLYAHDDFTTYPIGQWRQIEINGRVRMQGWIPGGAEYEDIKPIRSRVRDGLLKAVSIGFYIRKAERVEPTGAGEEQHGEQGGYVRITSFEIVECSVCAVGAHESAVIDQTAVDALKAKARKAESLAPPKECRWESQQLFDVEKGGPKGTLWRLSWTPQTVGQDAEEQPYPNEHACRLVEPEKFEPASFRRTEREHEGKKYGCIMGKLKGESTMTEQAYRYPKDAWTEAQAKAHCKTHEGILFEPASAEDAAPKAADAQERIIIVPASTQFYSPDIMAQMLIALQEIKQGISTLAETLKPKQDAPKAEDESEAEGPVVPQCCTHGEHPDPDAQHAEPQAPQTGDIIEALKPILSGVVRQVISDLPELQALMKVRAQRELEAQATQRRQNRRRFLSNA